MKQVWKTDLKPTPKFVLLALANRADEEGICWPSQNDISDSTGLKHRAISYAVSDLQSEGLIVVEKMPPNRNKYTLNLTAIEAKEIRIKCAIKSKEIRIKCATDTQNMRIHSALDAQQMRIKCASKETPMKPQLNPNEQIPAETSSATEKNVRQRDLIFDAIAEVCSLDLSKGSVIGKTKQKLLECKPPVTADEILLFGKVYAKQHPIRQVPKWQELIEQIGIVRNAGKVQSILSGSGFKSQDDKLKAHHARVMKFDPAKQTPLLPDYDDEEILF